MTKIILTYILTLFTLFTFASEPLKIGVMTDMHYLSEQLMDGEYATQDYVFTSARDIIDMPALLDSVLTDMAKSNIQVLLISGDIVKDGEKQSHLDFVKKLKPLQDKGIRVFVTPGNHDIGQSLISGLTPIQYIGNKTIPTEGTAPDQFVEIYQNCGYGAAFTRDTFSLSYAAALDEKTWLLAIDVVRDKKYAKEGINLESISPQTEQWITDILDQAAQKQVQVIGMMHWGLVEHIAFQSQFFPKYLIYDWQRLATVFADKGMKAIFTGHFHANDITEFATPDGNKIYDIETGALCSYPFAYRIIDLYDDKMDITTKNVLSIPQNPSLGDKNKVLLKQLAYNMASSKLKNMNMNFDDIVISQLSEIMSQILLLHVFGDEHMTMELEIRLKLLAEDLGDDAADYNISQLDFPPADNNVTLEF